MALLFNFGVVFINGWTDAPNCIATCVTTRCMEPKKAIIMAAIGNLIGTILIGFLAVYLSKITGDVSQTIAGIVSLPAPTYTLDHALIAISFGLLANILFSLGCTYYGFPSSQSNALVGGLTGAGMALAALNGSNWFSPVGWDAWEKVLIGFFGSIALGFALGYGLTYLIQLICRKMRKGDTTRFFTRGQVVASGLMSIAHGVQDGAKFIGVYLVIAAMLEVDAGGSASISSAISNDLMGQWWIVIPVAVVITCGTLVGGKSIIKTMGSGMAKLDKYRGFATDIAAFLGLMLATIFGLPVSSGTVKATAIMGCGAAKSFRQVHWGKAGEMVLSWILIFPGTALIAFVLTMVFASIF